MFSNFWRAIIFDFTEIYCKKPANGLHTREAADVRYRYNMTYEYRCIDGYRTTEDTLARCLQNKAWSIPAPNCFG